MPYLPCINPECKSYGKPHPNCRCRGGDNKYASGGEAAHFCSRANAHDQGCEYFVDGGSAEVPTIENSTRVDGDEIPTVDNATPVKDAYVPTIENATPAHVPTIEDATPVTQQPISMGDSILRDFEAEARGVVPFGLSTAFETNVLGMDPKGIQQRAADTSGFISPDQLEGAGFVGSMLSPAGPFKVLMGALGKAVPTTVAASKLLNLAIQGAATSGSNAIQQNLVGKGGSTLDTVAQTLAGAAGNVVTGGIFNMLGAKYLNEKQIEAGAKWSEEFLQGLAKKAAASKPVSTGAAIGTFAGMNYLMGEELKHLASIPQSLLQYLGSGVIVGTGYKLEKAAFSFLKNKAQSMLSSADNYVGMAVLKALANEKWGAIPTAVKLGKAVANGVAKTLPATEALMKAGNAQLIPHADEFLRSTVADQVSSGALNEELDKQNNSEDPSPIPAQENPMPMAKGGAVGIQAAPNDKTDHLSDVWPEHAAMLGAAKARIHTYLNSVRPIETPTATFDDTHNDREKERSYGHAVELAVNPLSILNHVNQSTITPEIMKHFTSLHPEVHGMLSDKITQALIKEKMAGRKPPYSKRQSMSLFLGHDLDSVLSQPAIAAAQGVFMQKQASQQTQQQGQKQTPKKAKASLSKSSESALTQSQAREQRAQKV